RSCRGLATTLASCAMLAMLAVVLCARDARGQDDWQVIERHTTSQAPAAAVAATSAPAVTAADGTINACGETARVASEPYTTIVAQLNDMWGTNFKVYESLTSGSPHARDGGCIFYNQKFLDNLFQQWMKIDDPDTVKPMLYAIFAHEIGHLAHSDFDPANENVPIKNKELAADQFAGYSLERMGIRRLDSVEVTRYYQLTGDDFVGHASGHGNGEERTTAFEDGWHRAEIGLSEQGTQPAGGLGEP
ncbi:ImmA/IrrE family metallo-endopeptidase, partial [Candidatus Binatus sp.]